MSETVLLVGTRKGLWIARSDESRRRWEWDEPYFLMSEVASCGIDTRGDTPRLFAGVMSWHWGPQVLRSDDLGRTWVGESASAVAFPEDTGATLTRVWQVAPSAAEPDVVYAGTEPSAIFRSEDRGESFTLIRGLWDHPHRKEWQPGGGGQAIHTILPHPTEAKRVSVAMSTGGVYRTVDAGASWAPANQGIRATFLPEGEQFPEFGQCVHKVDRHPDRPERLFLQNHDGVYRSDDGGDAWVSIADGLSSDFGFPIVSHPHQPETVYVFPLGGAEERMPPKAEAKVWRSRDAGATWEGLSDGLPDGFYAAVMRDAMCTDRGEPAGIYFGSRDGTVFASNDEGDSWNELAGHLPDVLSVRAAVV
ncbi:MAG: exo-alpha-sialidase [Propionibacteriales bacterium]|nr:exo-alpha-sialidase [Propionibacteriales bacterium]